MPHNQMDVSMAHPACMYRSMGLHPRSDHMDSKDSLAMAPKNIRMSTCNYDLPACRSHAQQVAHRPLLLPEENVWGVFNFVPDTFHTGRLFGSLLSFPNKSNIIYAQQLGRRVSTIMDMNFKWRTQRRLERKDQ